MKLLFIFTLVMLCFKTKSQTYNVNSIVTCGNNRISALEILEQRIPLSNLNSSIPDDCRAEVNKAKSDWRADDKNNIDKIVNEYCSHKNGWTEYVPGTCNAGGPPPICPVNHWYKDINKAQQQWKEKLDGVLKKRADEMKSIACNCWGNSLQNSFEAKNNTIMRAIAPKADIDNQPSQEMNLPCLQIAGSEPCPPNYKCKNGYCIPINDVQKGVNTLSSLGGKALEKIAKDKLKVVLAEFSTTLSAAYKVYSNPWAKALMKAFTPSNIATNIDGYENSSNRLKENLSDYYTLLLELNRYEHNTAPARDKKYIVADLNSTKTKMNDNYMLMDQFYRGIKIEKELFTCKDCCENAFDIYNQQLGTYYLIFNSISY